MAPAIRIRASGRHRAHPDDPRQGRLAGRRAAARHHHRYRDAGARGADAGAARQLSLEISEEANQVDAILSAMERIQNVGSDDDGWHSGRASLI